MSACIAISDRHKWWVGNWVFHQFLEDIRAAYGSDQALLAYLEAHEPILFDDLTLDQKDRGWLTSTTALQNRSPWGD